MWRRGRERQRRGMEERVEEGLINGSYENCRRTTYKIGKSGAYVDDKHADLLTDFTVDSCKPSLING